MISRQWPERLIYTTMSVFVAWYTIAVAVAPLSENSVIATSLRRFIDPYITLFYLDHKWDFFAPDVDRGRQLRYVVEDASGIGHSFVPLHELNQSHPAYRRVSYWYDAVVQYPDSFGNYIADYLCRKHAALHPISITLIGVEEQDFSPSDQLSGKHPLDSDIAKVSTLKIAKCPGP